MWFAYMDEAGNTGRNLNEASQPIHLIATLLFDESKITFLHDYIRDTARKHCPRDCRHDDFEFHGKDLFAGEGYFANMPPSKRIEIYDDVLRGIGIAEGQVVIRGVDKELLRKRYAQPFHPHDIALMFTIESVERFAQDLDCRVLLVADEAREVEDAALRDLASYQEFGTSWGWNTEDIDHIIDTIHFVPSHRNPAVQLADCVTFIAGRKRKSDRGLVTPNSAVADLWTDCIEPYVAENAVWHPAT